MGGIHHNYDTWHTNDTRAVDSQASIEYKRRTIKDLNVNKQRVDIVDKECN